MRFDEAAQFIDSTIKPLWSGWEIERVELDIWARRLSYFDETTLKRAVEEFYCTPKGQFKKPDIAQIIKLANKFKPEKQKEEINKADSQPVIGYSLKCIETGKVDNYYYGSKQQRDALGSDFIMRIASRAAENACKSRGGTWVVIRYDESLKQIA